MILIIDDDIAIRTSLNLLLTKANFKTIDAANPELALEILNKHIIELILLDMNFSLETSGQEGFQLLKEIKKIVPDIPVILITAWGSISLAVEGMKAGAVDFISKPWNNDHLLNSVKTSLSLSLNTKQITKSSRKQLDKNYDFEKLIGEDPTFISVLETVGRVSTTDASVLILGESGTGKELVAEAIHQSSPRKNEAFVKVNLGGISTSLFEICFC